MKVVKTRDRGFARAIIHASKQCIRCNSKIVSYRKLLFSEIKKSENLFSETNTPLMCYYFELMNLFGGSEYALLHAMNSRVHVWNAVHCWWKSNGWLFPLNEPLKSTSSIFVIKLRNWQPARSSLWRQVCLMMERSWIDLFVLLLLYRILYYTYFIKSSQRPLFYLWNKIKRMGTPLA